MHFTEVSWWCGSTVHCKAFRHIALGGYEVVSRESRGIGITHRSIYKTAKGENERKEQHL